MSAAPDQLPEPSADRPADRRPDRAIVPPEILRHYETGLEKDRLSTGDGALELVRTQELLGRHLPPPPGRVIDIGGGPGAYAVWLAGLGYDVDLIDAVPLHVEQARQAAAAAATAGAALTVRAALGDARALAFDDGIFDAALLLGPLYHLTEREHRLRAIAEALRVSRPGAPVLAVGISRFASALGGLVYDFLGQPEFDAIVERDLAEGQHRNPTERLDYFTTAYFHHPDELAAEMREAGARLEGLVAIDGPGWLVPGIVQRMEKAPARERILAALRAIESEPSLIGASAHFLAVGRKA